MITPIDTHATEELLVRRIAEARIPTRWGDFTCYAYESLLDGEQHVAMVKGAVAGEQDVLVRVHSECLTGDVFGSHRCDCGVQLDSAMAMMAEEGRGALVYLRGHEGRGIGIGHKIRAYSLQDEGHDTVEANEQLGFEADLRDYQIAAAVVRWFNLSAIRLLSNNPDKIEALTKAGVDVVERTPIVIPALETTADYLRTKKEKLGHLF